MAATKKDMLLQLEKDILDLQGFKPPLPGTAIDFGLGPVAHAFPNHHFPTAAIHEFISTQTEHAAATQGFVSGLLASLMKGGRVCIWISMSRTLFSPALKTFGIDPEKIIFINIQHPKELLWVMEEALKCEGLAAVVGEIPAISFTASRRLQLAVEQSRVTGFLLRHQLRNLNTTACVSRWRIIPLPGVAADGMPGVGLPRWNVELLKIRNGKPGNWQIEWSAGGFLPVYQAAVPSLPAIQIKKTG